ncbi:MAG: MFS transporter [Candidatus Bathyarchaeia archaeon]|nr:MFS transporter [Candidatus Bathyarchaeia archaeon]
MFKYLRREFSFVFGNVLILLIGWAVTDFAYLLPDTYYSLFVESLGASPFLIGTILSASWFVMAFLQLAGGYWADKRGRKILIISASFGRALIFLIFAAAPTWHFILLGEILVGISAISQPALMAIVADSLPPEKRGLGFSLSMVVGATSILSPIVAGILYLKYDLVNGMRIAYLIVSACWFASGLILFRLTETLKTEKTNVSWTEVFKQYPKAFKECITVWKLVPKSMLYLLLVFTPVTFFIRMCTPYYVLYANHVLKIEEFQWALLQTSYSVVFYSLLLPTGKLVDVFGRKKPLLLSSVFFAFGIVLFMYGDVVRLYIFFALSAIGNALIFTAHPSLQADLTPKEYRGKVMGFSNFIDCLLGSGALLLGGFLYENVSPITPFLLLLAIMIFTAVATFIFITEPKTKEN